MIFNIYEPPENNELCKYLERKDPININTVVLWVYRAFFLLLAISTYMLLFYFKLTEYALSVGVIVIIGGLLDIVASLILMKINDNRTKVDNVITRNAESLSKLYERTKNARQNYSGSTTESGP